MQVDRIQLDERLEERAHDIALERAGDGVRIEISDVAAVADMQDLFAVALLDSRFAARAGAGEERERDDGGDECRRSIMHRARC